MNNKTTTAASNACTSPHRATSPTAPTSPSPRARRRSRFDVGPHLHHAGGAVHGANYFKAMDDAAFFAANSLVDDVFVLTVSFNVYFLRPHHRGLPRRPRHGGQRQQEPVGRRGHTRRRPRPAARTRQRTFMRSRMALTMPWATAARTDARTSRGRNRPPRARPRTHRAPDHRRPRTLHLHAPAARRRAPVLRPSRTAARDAAAAGQIPAHRLRPAGHPAQPPRDVGAAHHHRCSVAGPAPHPRHARTRRRARTPIRRPAEVRLHGVAGAGGRGARTRRFRRSGSNRSTPGLETSLPPRLKARRAPLKSLLLDQHLVAGVGNIYAVEALWRAGIRPTRPGHRTSIQRLTGCARGPVGSRRSRRAGRHDHP